MKKKRRIWFCGGIEQAAAQQFASQKPHAARRVKMIHVRAAVGIDLRQQRRDRGQVGEVVPGHDDASRPRHRHQMQGVIGRPTRGQ